MKTKDNMRSNDFDAKESTVLLQEEGSLKVPDVLKENDFTLLQQEKRTLSCATKISIFLIIATVLTSMVILDVKLSGRSLYEESSSPIIDEELNDKELFTVANYDVDTKTMAYLSAHKEFFHIDTDFFNDGGIIFYKGNRAAVQDVLCGKSGKKTREFRSDPFACANDNARSAKIFNTRKGTAFAVYDNSNLSMEDDFAIIEVTKDIDDVGCFVDTFQSSTTSCGVRVTYYRNNGLDGKVSAWSIQPNGVWNIIGNGLILFYEGNNGSQNLVCTLKVKPYQWFNFKDKNISGGCDNDEARSLVLSYVKAGTTIKIYDSPKGKTNDDYTVIQVKRSSPYYIVNSFERNINNDYVKATYHRKNGLDGKVSHVKIDMS